MKSELTDWKEYFSNSNTIPNSHSMHLQGFLNDAMQMRYCASRGHSLSFFILTRFECKRHWNARMYFYLLSFLLLVPFYSPLNGSYSVYQSIPIYQYEPMFRTTFPPPPPFHHNLVLPAFPYHTLATSWWGSRPRLEVLWSQSTSSFWTSAHVKMAHAIVPLPHTWALDAHDWPVLKGRVCPSQPLLLYWPPGHGLLWHCQPGFDLIIFG